MGTSRSQSPLFSLSAGAPLQRRRKCLSSALLALLLVQARWSTASVRLALAPKLQAPSTHKPTRQQHFIVVLVLGEMQPTFPSLPPSDPRGPCHHGPPHPPSSFHPQHRFEWRVRHYRLQPGRAATHRHRDGQRDHSHKHPRSLRCADTQSAATA